MRNWRDGSDELEKLKPKSKKNMTEEQITMGSILLNKKKMLIALRDRVRESFQDLNENSSDEDVARFITNIIKMGYKDSLWPSILRMVGDIERDIIDLDDKIRRL